MKFPTLRTSPESPQRWGLTNLHTEQGLWLPWDNCLQWGLCTLKRNPKFTRRFNFHPIYSFNYHGLEGLLLCISRGSYEKPLDLEETETTEATRPHTSPEGFFGGLSCCLNSIFDSMKMQMGTNIGPRDWGTISLIQTGLPCFLKGTGALRTRKEADVSPAQSPTQKLPRCMWDLPTSSLAFNSHPPLPL